MWEITLIQHLISSITHHTSLENPHKTGVLLLIDARKVMDKVKGTHVASTSDEP
jgi:hypothetical protein